MKKVGSLTHWQEGVYSVPAETLVKERSRLKCKQFISQFLIKNSKCYTMNLLDLNTKQYEPVG